MTPNNPLKASNSPAIEILPRPNGKILHKYIPHREIGIKIGCNDCGRKKAKKWYAGPTCIKCYYDKRHAEIYKANPEYYRKLSQEFRKRRPDLVENSLLKNKYGITLKDYQQMLSNQNGVCKICKNPEKNKRLAVDHCHTTGKIRGLLCARCNLTLGALEDNTDLLNQCIQYLKDNS